MSCCIDLDQLVTIAMELDVLFLTYVAIVVSMIFPEIFNGPIIFFLSMLFNLVYRFCPWPRFIDWEEIQIRMLEQQIAILEREVAVRRAEERRLIAELLRMDEEMDGLGANIDSDLEV